MVKLLVLVAVAIGALLYFPQTRPLVAERFRPVLDRVFTWATNDEMERIARDLTRHEEVQSEFPSSEEEFQTWMAERYQSEDAATDSWGTRYLLRRSGASFEVISAGPDEKFGTEDDLTVTGQRQNPSGPR